MSLRSWSRARLDTKAPLEAAAAAAVLRGYATGNLPGICVETGFSSSIASCLAFADLYFFSLVVEDFLVGCLLIQA